jgi:hypothetical protein
MQCQVIHKPKTGELRMEKTQGNRYPSRYKKTLVFMLALSTVLWQCAFSSENIATDNSEDPVLRFKLEAQSLYTTGQHVPVVFILENLTDKDIYVLTWYTPLEGLKGRIFKVMRDGVEIPYEGRMIKRGNPLREDYIHIGPRGSVSTTVDLASTYNMNTTGEYRVEFIRHIYDLAFDESIIPRKQAKHQEITISGNAVTFHVKLQ